MNSQAPDMMAAPVPMRTPTPAAPRTPFIRGGKLANFSIGDRERYFFTTTSWLRMWSSELERLLEAAR